MRYVSECFINRGEDEIGRLMHDFTCTAPDKMYNKDIAEVTRYYKENTDCDRFCHAIRRRIDGTKSKIIIQSAQIIGLF